MNTVEKTVLLWMDYLILNPAKVAFLSLLLFGLFLIGLPKFDMNPSPRDYMGKDLPVVQRLIELEQEYIEDTNIFIMLMPDDGNIFTKKTLSAIHEFTESAWQLPNVVRVDSISNFQHTTADGDDLLVQSLIGSVTELNKERIATIKNVSLNEPFLLNSLVSDTGHATGINILFSVDLGDNVNVASIYRQLDEIKAQFKNKYPEIHVYESGYVSMVSHWLRAAYLDVKHVFSLSGVIILLGMTWFFSSFRASLAVCFIGILSVLVSLGFLGLLGKVLNPATLLSTLMVLVLGLADGIHITKNVQRFLGEGYKRDEAIKRSVVANFMPILLTSVTTAIGFLTFNFSGYSGIELMGNFVAFGVLVAFILSITLLPVLLRYCGLETVSDRNTRFSGRLSSVVVKYNKHLLIITVPSIIFCLFCISLIEFDERMTRYLRDDYVYTAHLDKIQEELTGTTSIIYNFKSVDDAGVSSPDFMAKIEAFVEWSRLQPEVRYVSSYTDTVKRLNKNLHADNAEYYRLPEDANLAAQYILLYEMSLPYGLTLSNHINLDKTAVRVFLGTNDLSLNETKAILKRNTDWLAQYAPDLNPIANSDSITSLLVTEKSFYSIMLSGIFALVIIGIILLLTFRSFLAGLLCVVSVITPILVSYGLWGLFVGRIGLSGAFAMCMVIGIAVDFSVHFISKFVYARRQLSLDAERSVRYAFNLVSTPIITSVVVLGGGFLILVVSVFEYNVVMGTLTSLCIMFSAISTFLLIPSLLLSNKFRIQ